MAIKYRKEDDGPVHTRAELLRNDILNSPYHVFGAHANCDKYFCTGEKDGEQNFVPKLKEEGILIEIGRFVYCYDFLFTPPPRGSISATGR